MAEASQLGPDFWCVIDGFFLPADMAEARTAWRTELGVSAVASGREIKTAYRELCLEFHPDRHGDASPSLRKLAEEKLKCINEAYEMLTTGPIALFMVQTSGEIWVDARNIEDEAVLHCAVCHQANRVSKTTILESRCGCCHAQLALHREFVAKVFTPTSG